MPRRRPYGVEFTKEEFRREFPKLAEEIEERVTQYPVGGVRRESSNDESELRDPNAISYLRRCSTVEEAEEIIAYMERTGEITEEYADELRKQARQQGLASFGEKKERGYYFTRYWRRGSNARDE